MSADSPMMQKAIAFLTEQLRDNPKKNLTDLCDEAGVRFNLSPIEVDSLARILKDTLHNNEQ